MVLPHVLQWQVRELSPGASVSRMGGRKVDVVRGDEIGPFVDGAWLVGVVVGVVGGVVVEWLGCVVVEVFPETGIGTLQR